MVGPAAGTPETAWAFVREHLRHLPVTVEQDPNGELRVIRERLPDRLYDRMEAFHLTRNLAIPVTAAEFYEGLSQRFPERDGMHFLDEQVEAYERQRMTIKDLKAAQLFITDEESAIQWLRQFLKTRRSPQPYAAIQPEFFREVQAGLPDWEEPPDLKVLLERSCLQDDEGRWYVPDPKKEADLEKLRKRERLKEFATYAVGQGPAQALQPRGGPGRVLRRLGAPRTSRRSSLSASGSRPRRSPRTSGCSSTSTTPSSSRAEMEPAWWPARGEPVTVLAIEELWGQSIATVPCPSTGSVERVAAAELQPLARQAVDRRRGRMASRDRPGLAGDGRAASRSPSPGRR